MVAEDSKENFDNASFCVGQRRAVGVTEISRLNHFAIKHASLRKVARHDVHIGPALAQNTINTRVERMLDTRNIFWNFSNEVFAGSIIPNDERQRQVDGVAGRLSAGPDC
jgi:hypothetical protein